MLEYLFQYAGVSGRDAHKLRMQGTPYVRVCRVFLRVPCVDQVISAEALCVHGGRIDQREVPRDSPRQHGGVCAVVESNRVRTAVGNGDTGRCAGVACSTEADLAKWYVEGKISKKI